MRRTLDVALVLLIFFLAGCAKPDSHWPPGPLSLASFSENGASVTVQLTQDVEGHNNLSATFTPLDPQGHLFDKDTPVDGVNGVGRPTRIELPASSRLQADGDLMDPDPTEPVEGVDGLFQYPDGPVTLMQPVMLPEGSGWYDEQISITYMVCTGGVCHAPVVEKLVTVHVPGRSVK